MCYWPVSRVVLEDPPKKKKEENKKKPNYIMVSDQFNLQPIVSPKQHSHFPFLHHPSVYDNITLLTFHKSYRELYPCVTSQKWTSP